VELAEDLSTEALAELLPGRPVRAYPALLSTEADALAWARADAPEGALVVADYQASPRGRGGRPWQVPPGRSLAFSMVLRPRMPAEREGWTYTVATSGLADVIGGTIEWPDEVRSGGDLAGAVGVYTELGPAGTAWAVVNVFVSDAPPPRGPLLARVVDAIEARYHSSASGVLAEYLPRCETIGRRVRARLVPLGPSGVKVTGRAVRTLTDGALVVETAEGRPVAVRPQNLGVLEDAPSSD
jgi:BirA family biotin operon repressor/biotin-[acetyl-CoA-carboxylase] ligase